MANYLAFIHLYTRLHRRPPAETDMQEYFRVTPPSVHQMVLTLERAGFIRRDAAGANLTPDTTYHNHCAPVLRSNVSVATIATDVRLLR